MEAEDIINLPDSSNSFSRSGSSQILDSINRPADSLASNSMAKDDGTRTENMDVKGGDPMSTENDLTEKEGTPADDSSVMQIGVEMSNAISVEDKLNCLKPQVDAETIIMVEEKLDTYVSRVHAENGCHEVQNESPSHHRLINARSGVKRARMTFDDQQPSVHVIYNFITRASKQKLQELLRQWSEWQAEECSSTKDPNDVIKFGEETYFPALRVGSEKPFSVSFWIDSQTRGEEHVGFIPPESNSVPLYDRGCALGSTSVDGSNNLFGSLEVIDNATRCFNCGSYSHSLKECPKPRDNVAVNKARQQYMAKKKQSGGSRNPIRYYQNTPGGKYDDLKPGILSAETRQLLGLGEYDPHPWLNKMRELGYPPGYLAPEDEDQPSGITIFADEEIKEHKDGEVFEMKHPQRQQKRTVEFPGINAPIPANADATRWAAVSSSADPSRYGAHQQSIYNPKPDGKGNRGQGLFRDYDDGPPGINPGFSPAVSYRPIYGANSTSFGFHSPTDYVPGSRSRMSGRLFRDYDDDGAPGISPGFSPGMSYPPRNGIHNTSFIYRSPSDYVSRSRCPNLGRSLSDRSWGESPLGCGTYNDDGPPGVDAHHQQRQSYGYCSR